MMYDNEVKRAASKKIAAKEIFSKTGTTEARNDFGLLTKYVREMLI